MADVHQRIIDFLNENEVQFEQLQHDHVHASEEAAKIRGNTLEQAAKALVLKDKKSGEFFMFIVGGDRRLSLNKIKKEILHSKNVSLAPPDEVFERTGCKVGTVPPLGNLFNLKTFLDKHLADTQDVIVFSAATHHDSVKMRSDDFIRVTGVEVRDYSEVVNN